MAVNEIFYIWELQRVICGLLILILKRQKTIDNGNKNYNWRQWL